MRQYGDDTLHPAIRSRMIAGVNGLDMHVLEAGYETPGRPLVLLLHGFPELAYSWRNQMVPLAEAGYHVVAPDQRGYGRTSGWTTDFDSDIAPFRMLNVTRDALGLVGRLGYPEVAAVIGHDFGASVAAWATLVRPDVFRSMVIMSAPFSGAPSIPFGEAAVDRPKGSDIHAAMAVLPRPRKHYQWYYSTRPANADMWRAPQGVHAFLRAYFHHKSADWKANRPYRLAGWTAEALAEMPTYYIMPLALGMGETVAAEMPSAAEIAACGWLTEQDLAVYAGEYERTSFQGGLHWYHCRTSGRFQAEHELFSGRTIDVPSMFISGKSDWGVYQVPGAFEAMQSKVCTAMHGCHLLDGAGHWVQQEQAEAVTGLLLGHLERVRAG